MFNEAHTVRSIQQQPLFHLIFKSMAQQAAL
jgi:hypothetical protein